MDEDMLADAEIIRETLRTVMSETLGEHLAGFVEESPRIGGESTDGQVIWQLEDAPNFESLPLGSFSIANFMALFDYLSAGQQLPQVSWIGD
jgi:hypothetical protein